MQNNEPAKILHVGNSSGAIRRQYTVPPAGSIAGPGVDVFFYEVSEHINCTALFFNKLL